MRVIIDSSGKRRVIEGRLRCALRRCFEKITLRHHYREKYRVLYLTRIANLVDYLDKEKATIVVGELRNRTVNMENSNLLVCGDCISIMSNLICFDGKKDNPVIEARTAKNIQISHNVLDGK